MNWIRCRLLRLYNHEFFWCYVVLFGVIGAVAAFMMLYVPPPRPGVGSVCGTNMIDVCWRVARVVDTDPIHVVTPDGKTIVCRDCRLEVDP